jgi:hypothetical protein
MINTFRGTNDKDRTSLLSPAAAIRYRFLNKLYNNGRLHRSCHACILERRGTHLYGCSISNFNSCIILCQYDCIYEHSTELLQCTFCMGGWNHYLGFRLLSIEGTRWRCWLRHCVTSPKVAGSIPDGGLNFIALGSTQPLKEMSTRKSQPLSKADNLTAFTCRLSWNLVASISLNPQCLSRTVMGLVYPYLLCTEIFLLSSTSTKVQGSNQPPIQQG